MEFTKQEQQVLRRIIDGNNWDYIVWEAVYLVPSVALIVFGALDNSMRSIIVGIGVIVFIRIFTVFRQSKKYLAFQGLCNKIDALISNEPKTD
jgi:hypothetical protein